MSKTFRKMLFGKTKHSLKNYLKLHYFLTWNTENQTDKQKIDGIGNVCVKLSTNQLYQQHKMIQPQVKPLKQIVHKYKTKKNSS